MADAKNIIGLGILGVGGYFLGQMLGWWGTPATTAPTAPGVAPGATTPPAAPVPPGTCVGSPTAQMLALITALVQAAHGANSLNVSQWNYYLTNTVAPGTAAAQMPEFGSQNISATQFVCGMVNDGIALPAPSAPATTTGTTTTGTTSSSSAAGQALKANAVAQLQSGIAALTAQIAAIQPQVATNPLYQAMLPGLQAQLASLQNNLIAVQGLSGYRGMSGRVMTRARRINYIPRYA
jgi:hypothetical protein